MSTVKELQSTCGLCLIGCGVLVTVKNGKVIDVKGDPQSPLNHGALCEIGHASIEYLNHPDRLKYPLKRIGKRGEGRWQQISWEEAIDITAGALGQVRRNTGPEAVVMVQGSAKGYMDTHLVRFANSFGTPNVVCGGHVCHIPKELASEMTLGFFPGTDSQSLPECMILWGINPSETFSTVMHRPILEAHKKGVRLIVIDPLETEFAKMADTWLRIRPGSDLALALGMLHVIIREGLYDKDFVNNWTIGFHRLKEHVKDYTPDKVAEWTWIPEAKVCELAKGYATSRPGKIAWGNALDHNVNSFQNARAISILMAITGNLGVPGGEIETMGSGLRQADPWQPELGIHGRYSSELENRARISPAKRKKKVGGETLNLLTDYRYVIPQAVIKSIVKGEPYAIRAAYVQGSNPLSSWCNISETCRAFKMLDFIAVSDMFMTPTAALADVVFPMAGYLEQDAVVPPVLSNMVQAQRKFEQIGECRSNHETIISLARKLGLEKDFHNDVEAFWNYILAPERITFAELKEKGRHALKNMRPVGYRMYATSGFRTPSGKVELYSKTLESQGLDPLPAYRPPSAMKGADTMTSARYPLLCTSRKKAQYRHSEGRQISSLRNSHPDPIVIINAETAKKLEIKEGDWVYVENQRGRMKQKASLSSGVDRRVIVAEQAWWFPENGVTDLFGFMESNYNALTSEKPPFSPEMGSFNIRGLACRVYKA